MPTYMNTNIGAMNAMRYMNVNSMRAEKAGNQLSSGSIVSDPSDAPSKAAVGYAMGSKINSLMQASSTIIQASSMIQLASGALEQTADILITMKQLASQSVSGSIENSERDTLNEEFQALLNQINNNASTSWGTTQLLSGGVPTLTGDTSTPGTTYVTADNGVALTASYGTGGTLNGTAAFYPGAGADITSTYEIGYLSDQSSFTLTKTSGGITTTLYGMMAPSYDPNSTTPINDTVYFADGSSLKLQNFSTNPVPGTPENVFFSQGIVSSATTGATAASTFVLHDTTNTPPHITAHIPNSLDLSFQTGSGASEKIVVSFPSLNIHNLGLFGKSIEISTNAQTAMVSIDAALQRISQDVSMLGSKKSQMEFANKNIQVAIENQSAAKATFTDADIEKALLEQKQSSELFSAAASVFQNAIAKQSEISRLIQDILRT